MAPQIKNLVAFKQNGLYKFLAYWQGMGLLGVNLSYVMLPKVVIKCDQQFNFRKKGGFHFRLECLECVPREKASNALYCMFMSLLIALSAAKRIVNSA